jgi:RNA polymerase sigma-70 factor (ECF subfamily)
MSDTSASLLARLRADATPADWRRLVELYTPLIQDWLRRQGLQAQDADDLTQEVLAALVRELPGFRYDPQRGSFRGWLRTITVNRLRDFWRARGRRPAAPADSDFERRLAELADPASDQSRQWDFEHDRHVARRLLELIRPEFEPRTWRAFQRVALEGAKPAAVAAELGVTTNAVFVAKSRILRRLRQEIQGLAE